MPTASEAYRDRILSHQVGLQRLSTRQVKRSLALLERTARELRRRLRRRLEREAMIGFDPGPLSSQRLRAMLDEVEDVLKVGYRQIREQVTPALIEASVAEADYAARALRRSIPGDIAFGIGIPPPEVLAQIATARPFQGKLLREHFDDLPRLMRRQIKRAVQEGLVAGDTVEGIIRRIPWYKGRNDLKAVVDSAVKHVSQSARDQFLAANAGDDGVVKGAQWLSTLDLRTTKTICVPRDGKPYTVPDHKPVGHGYDWGGGPGRIHYRCRSAQTAILKSWEELGIDANELTGATRASMDGAVPRKTTAVEFFKSRKWTDRELRRMFGKRRAAKILAGDLTIENALVQVGIPRGLVKGVGRLRAPKVRAPKKPAPRPATEVPEFKTTKEAEEWARQNLVRNPYETVTEQLISRATGEIVSETSKQVSRVNYRGISAAAANLINRRVAAFQEMGAAKLREIKVSSPRKAGWSAQYRSGFSDGSLFINRKIAKSLDAVPLETAKNKALMQEMRSLLPGLRSAQQAGKLPARLAPALRQAETIIKFKRFGAGSRLEDIINHELGHHIDKFGTKASQRVFRSAERRQWREAVAEAVKEQAGEAHKHNLSYYAFSNPFDQAAEVFAESVALYLEGSNRSDLSPKMLALLKRIFG